MSVLQRLIEVSILNGSILMWSVALNSRIQLFYFTSRSNSNKINKIKIHKEGGLWGGENANIQIIFQMAAWYATVRNI